MAPRPEEQAWRFARYHFTKGGWDLEKLGNAPQLAIAARPRLHLQVADELVNAKFSLHVKFETLDTEETLASIIVHVVGVYETTFGRNDDASQQYAIEIGQHASERLPPLALAEAMRIMKMAGVDAPLDIAFGSFTPLFDFKNPKITPEPPPEEQAE